MTSRNWEVVYRCQDSLATCNIWAPDEAQAEKKFRARKEFEYDPEYDREDDGSFTFGDRTMIPRQWVRKIQKL